MSSNQPGISRRAAVSAGVVAGAAAIGLSELLAGVVSGAPSLVMAIGQLAIALQPAGAKEIVVGLFGEFDKLALNVAVTLVALASAAGLGLLARRHGGWATAGFAIVGLLALVASLMNPLNDPLLSVLVSGAAVATASWVLRALLAAATAGRHDAEMPDWARRRFIGTSLAVAGGAVVAGSIGRFLLDREQAQAVGLPALPPPSAKLPPLKPDTSLDVPGITPIVMPNDRFYRIDTQLLTPHLDATDWKMTVTGLVDRPLSLTYADLLAMPQLEQYVTIACVSNEVGGPLVGNARWSGVRLREVLDRAGVKTAASQVVGRAFDGWTAGFPTSWLDAPGREAMIAVGMNGERLPPAHGFPARLIVPGLYGYVSATKWLTNIELTTLEAFDAYWIELGWSKDGPILTQSRIDTPRPGGSVLAGRVPVAGVAWAPDRGIRSVEVQVDDGPWQEAQLSDPISPATWVQFVYRWQATPGQHRLRVRASDGSGILQSSAQTPPAPDGARGYHTVEVTVQ